MLMRENISEGEVYKGVYVTSGLTKTMNKEQTSRGSL